MECWGEGLSDLGEEVVGWESEGRSGWGEGSSESVLRNRNEETAAIEADAGKEGAADPMQIEKQLQELLKSIQRLRHND